MFGSVHLTMTYSKISAIFRNTHRSPPPPNKKAVSIHSSYIFSRLRGHYYTLVLQYNWCFTKIMSIRWAALYVGMLKAMLNWRKNSCPCWNYGQERRITTHFYVIIVESMTCWFRHHLPFSSLPPFPFKSCKIIVIHTSSHIPRAIAWKMLLTSCYH